MKHGGKRTGAGRPIGSKAPHTLEAEAFRQYLITEAVKSKQAIVASLIQQAVEGKIPAIKEILERMLGKADIGETLEFQKEAELNELVQKFKQAVKDMLTTSQN